MQSKEKITGWFLILLIIVLIVSVVRSWMGLAQRETVIENQQDRLQRAKEEKVNLERQLAKVKSQEYIEQEARNKLNLGKDGEIILLLPTLSPIVFFTPTPTPASSNLEQWLNVFL